MNPVFGLHRPPNHRQYLVEKGVKQCYPVLLIPHTGFESGLQSLRHQRIERIFPFGYMHEPLQLLLVWQPFRFRLPKQVRMRLLDF